MKRKNIGLISAITAVVLLVAVIAGFVIAKYVQKNEFKGTANITAELGTIQLLESKAIKNLNGSYSLDTDTPVTTNTYGIVLPGYNIPKDPYVVITDKSTIAAYVYVEVVDNGLAGANITYNLTDEWTKLSVTGIHDGVIYCYNNTVNSNVPKIQILKNNELVVSDELDKNAKDLKLDFYAYMAETAAGADAKAAYQNTFSTP